VRLTSLAPVVRRRGRCADSPCGAAGRGGPEHVRRPPRYPCQIRSQPPIARPLACGPSMLLTSAESGAPRPPGVLSSACCAVVLRQELRQRQPSSGPSTRFPSGALHSGRTCVERPVPRHVPEGRQSDRCVVLRLRPRADPGEQAGAEPTPAMRPQDVHLLDVGGPLPHRGNHHAHGQAVLQAGHPDLAPWRPGALARPVGSRLRHAGLTGLIPAGPAWSGRRPRECGGLRSSPG
jgi:hypothetical protein